MLNGTYPLPCLSGSILLVAAAKTHSENQALVAGTKQSKQVKEAGRLTGQSGLPNLFQACLLCFMSATSTLVLLKWMSHKLIGIEQSTFPRYLWAGCTNKAGWQAWLARQIGVPAWTEILFHGWFYQRDHDIHHNDIQHNHIIVTLSIKTLSTMTLNISNKYNYVEFRYAEYSIFLLLFWMPLCWLSLCWMSWRQ